MKNKNSLWVFVIATLITACGGSYEISDMKSFLQSGEWTDSENGSTLVFRGDGLYVWKFSYDGKFESDFHESFVRGLLASTCDNMEAYEAPDLSTIIDSCNLPNNASNITKPGWAVFSDKSYAVIDKYEVVNNQLHVTDMGDNIQVKIKAETETKFSYTDDVDTYHFSR